jgi:hypothetical protein
VLVLAMERDSADIIPDNTTTAVTVEDLTAQVVKERTGFKDLSSMPVFAMVACNSDIKVFNESVSSLTPLEERLLYVETVYGRVSRREVDSKREFGMARKIVCKIRC